MKNADLNFNFKSIIPLLIRQLDRIKPYRYIVFFIFISLLYGFIILRISAYSTAEPTQASIDSQVNARSNLFIDEKVVEQLQTLQDNSVSVQTLFDEARSNPFE